MTVAINFGTLAELSCTHLQGLAVVACSEAQAAGDSGDSPNLKIAELTAIHVLRSETISMCGLIAPPSIAGAEAFISCIRDMLPRTCQPLFDENNRRLFLNCIYIGQQP